MTEKVVIIGSGPAGWTAAVYAARANLNPLVYEGAVSDRNRVRGTLPLGQLALTTGVENWPGTPAGGYRELLMTALDEDRRPYWVEKDKPQPTHGINGPELMELMRKQALNFGTRIVTKDVLRVDLKSRPFKVWAANPEEPGSEETVEAMALIVATGRSGTDPLEPAADRRWLNRGLSKDAVSDGPLPRHRGRPVVVAGDGDAALEDAAFLSRFAARVYLAHRGREVRPRWMTRARCEAILSGPKVEPRLGWEVVEVLGTEEGGVTAARLRGPGGAAEEVACSGVFLAPDFAAPNTGFLGGQLELDGRGHIRRVRTHRTHTSVDGVFAAGDVADDSYRQAITGAAAGCMAALDTERWLASGGLPTGGGPTAAGGPPAPAPRPAASEAGHGPGTAAAMTEAEWLACADPEPMLEYLWGEASERKVRLSACACIRRFWDWIYDDRSKEAVELVERIVDGRADPAEYQRAHSLAYDAQYGVADEAMHRGDDLPRAYSSSAEAVYRCTEPSMRAYDWAIAVGSAANCYVSLPNSTGPELARERAEQAQLFRCLFGNPFRPVAPDPAWQTPDAVALARTMYESRDFSAMPLLADLLEEAGCPATISEHCRGPGPHARGCWVVDLVLGQG